MKGASCLRGELWWIEKRGKERITKVHDIVRVSLVSSECPLGDLDSITNLQESGFYQPMRKGQLKTDGKNS